jgi:hypothetical protein
MAGMTDFDANRLRNLETARQANGQFGAQAHTEPELAIFAASAALEDTTYRIYAGDALVHTGEKGAPLAEAIAAAHRYAEDEPVTLTVRAAADDGTGFAEVPVPAAGHGTIVGWHKGTARTPAELDAAGLSLSECDIVTAEEYLDLSEHDELPLEDVEQWARDADFQVSYIEARRDDEGGDGTEVHIDVNVTENFLWDADHRFGDDTAEDGDTRTPQERYEAWLDEHEATVKEVFLETFNADVHVNDSWEHADVSIRATLPRERTTPSLIIEDIYPKLAKYKNENDPGTWNSPYVMAEVRRRIDAAERELADAA